MGLFAGMLCCEVQSQGVAQGPCDQWLSDVITLTQGQLHLKSEFSQFVGQWQSGLPASWSTAGGWGPTLCGKDCKAFPAIWLGQPRSCAHPWTNSHPWGILHPDWPIRVIYSWRKGWSHLSHGNKTVVLLGRSGGWMLSGPPTMDCE